MAEDNEEYLVERIIEYRIRKGIKQYFVKWKGFSDGDNTWEPVDNLEQIKNGMEMVKEFHASSGLKSNTTAKEDAVEKEPKAGPSGVKRKPPPSSSDSSSSSDSGSSSEDDKPKTKVKMSSMKNGDSKKKSCKTSKKARVASSSSSSDSESEEENRGRKKAVTKKDNPTTPSKKPEPDEDKENIHAKTKSARSEPEVDLSEASTSEEDEAQMIQKELASVLPPSVKIPTTTVVASPAVQSAFRTIAEEPSPPGSGKPSPAIPDTHSSRAKAAKTAEEASTSSTMAPVKYESLPSYPKRPFEDDYKVKEIVHVTIINKQVVFLCRFEDLPHGLLDTMELCVLRYTQPDLVIKFFQERVRLVTLDKDGKAVLDNTSKLNAKETTSSKPAPVKREDTNKEQKPPKVPSPQKKPNDDKGKLTSLGLDVSSDDEDENISTLKSASSTMTIDKDKGKSRPESSCKKKDQMKKEDQRKKIAALGLEDSDDDDDLEIVKEKGGTKSKPDKKTIGKKKKKDKKVNDILDSLGLEASDSD